MLDGRADQAPSGRADARPLRPGAGEGTRRARTCAGDAIRGSSWPERFVTSTDRGRCRVRMTARYRCGFSRVDWISLCEGAR